MEEYIPLALLESGVRTRRSLELGYQNKIYSSSSLLYTQLQLI